MIKNKIEHSPLPQDSLNISASRMRAIGMAKIIGENLKSKRISLGLTRTDLANLINVSYQQIHKYETGKNIISAVLLYDLSLHLNIPVSNFYQGLEIRSSDAQNFSKPENRNLYTRETSELIQAFLLIKSNKLRQSLIKTITHISEQGQDD